MGTHLPEDQFSACVRQFSNRVRNSEALTNSVTLLRLVPFYRSPTVLSGSEVSNTASEHEQDEHSRLYFRAIRPFT